MFISIIALCPSVAIKPTMVSKISSFNDVIIIPSILEHRFSKLFGSLSYPPLFTFYICPKRPNALFHPILFMSSYFFINSPRIDSCASGLFFRALSWLPPYVSLMFIKPNISHTWCYDHVHVFSADSFLYMDSMVSRSHF